MIRERRNEEFIEELENLIEQYKSDALSMHHLTSKMKKLKHRYTAHDVAIHSRQEIAQLCEKFCEKGQEEKSKEMFCKELSQAVNEQRSGES